MTPRDRALASLAKGLKAKHPGATVKVIPPKPKAKGKK